MTCENCKEKDSIIERMKNCANCMFQLRRRFEVPCNNCNRSVHTLYEGVDQWKIKELEG